MRERGLSKTGIASLQYVQLAPMIAPGPTGARQEHLDAIISFAGAGHRRRLLRTLDILTITQSARRMPIPPQYAAHVFEERKNPTTKVFDDDGWIRSLTEAQEITAGVPEESVIYDQQAVDTQKVRPIQMEEFLRKYVSRRLLALSEGEIAAFTTAMRQLGVGSFTSSSTMNGFQDHWQLRWPESKWMKKCFRILNGVLCRAACRLLPRHAAAAGWKHSVPR